MVGLTATGWRARFAPHGAKRAKAERSGTLLLVMATSWLVLAFMCLLAFASLTTQTDVTLTPLRRQIGALLIGIAAAGYVLLNQRLQRGDWDRRAMLIGIVVIIAGLVNSDISYTWALDCLAVATAAIIAPPRWAVPAALVVWVLSIGAVFLEASNNLALTGIISVTTLLVASVLYSLTRLATNISDASYRSEQRALSSVDTERNRISRGLHDIIGRMLVVATLRNEAALRFLDSDVDRAREQMLQLQGSLLDGQAQLRRLVAGDVITDVTAEVAAGRGLCDRLGITCVIEVDDVPTGPVTVLAATVVREAVTNMLKHSRPRTCHIVVRASAQEAVITVVNDGVQKRMNRRQPDSPGTGLDDLRSRIEKVHGTFQAGEVEGQRFRLVAHIPVAAA